MMIAMMQKLWELILGRRTLLVTSTLALVVLSCIEVRDPTVEGPEDAGDVVATAQADPATTFEGGSATLSVNVEGGAEPLIFRWDQNGGPTVAIGNPSSAQASVTALTEPGRYTFRVTVTGADGSFDDDYAIVDVLSAVTIDAPPFAIVAEPVTLTANVAADSATPTYFWEVMSGTATLDNAATASPTFTARKGETVKVRLSVDFAEDSQSAAIRELDIVAVIDLAPRVRVETNLGDFVIELDGENTPRHMVNFLQYVDEGFYEGLLFHRNVCTDNAETGECDPFVLQGGGYRREGDELVAVDPTHDPVDQENATSASNGELYTIALALRGTPDSGTTQFFINLDENDFLDDSGFTVFGRVVEGADVVDAMAATERIESTIIPGEVSQPAEDIVIERIARVE
jgi:cyclophilin family peptidyl-prolyl cis-trans isomerase